MWAGFQFSCALWYNIFMEQEVNNTNTSPVMLDAFEQAFLQKAPMKTSFLAKHAKAILIVGIVAGIGLAAAGTLCRVLYQAKSDDGQTVAVLQEQLDDLEKQIQTSTASNDEVFKNTGFSSSFYQSSQGKTNLELEKVDLEAKIDTLTAENASANIFNTGAIYFWLGALVCWFVAVTLFLASKRRPKSVSIVGRA